MVKLNFCKSLFVGASDTESWEKLRIFSYGLPSDFWSKAGGGGVCRTAPPPPMENVNANYTILENMNCAHVLSSFIPLKKC